MKNLIRNILPVHRISSGKLTFLGCLLVGWIILHLPFFQNSSFRLFFTWDPSYWKQFGEPGMLAAFFNNFFSQFQTSPLGIFATQIVLVLIYLVCSYRVGARYALFMLPLWFVLMPSTRNAEQEMAFGILASLFALAVFFFWISYRETRKQSRRFYYEVFYLGYWIYYVLGGCLLFYFFGTAALLFLGTMVLYRIIILISSLLSKSSENVENSALAFGVYFITAVGIVFVFPRFLALPECVQHWSWIEWTALGAFSVAIIASLIQNTLKRNVQNPYPLSWKLLISSAVVCATLVVFHHNGIKSSYVGISNACTTGSYAKALEIGTRFFEKNPQAEENASEAELNMRASMSAYTRLALIMQGKLNTDFFKFRQVEEMQGMFNGLLPHTLSSDFAYARLYYEIELYGSAIPLMVYTLDHYGYEQRVFRLLIPIETATYQRSLLDKHLPLMKRSMGNRKFAKDWEKINLESIRMGIPNGQQPVGMGLKLNPSHTAIDHLVCQKVEKRLFGTDILASSWNSDRHTTIAKTINQNRPLNMPVLEYYSMVCLLNGKIELIPALASCYSQMEAVSLPAYLQEAALINSGLLEKHESSSELLDEDYMGFRFDPQIVERCIETARYLEENGNSPQADQLYGHTYTYYYLTRFSSTNFHPDNLNQPYCPNV